MTARTRTAVVAGLREYARTPVLLGLLVVLPAYLIVVFGWVIPSTPVPIDLPDGGRTTVAMADAYAALAAPMVGALIGGIAGLFVMRASRDADGRLVIAGYHPREVVLARFALLAVAGVVVTGVAMVAVWLSVVPERPGWLAVATLSAALIYSMLGSLAGLVLRRVTGVYLLLFGPMLDLFLYQNPLAADTPWFATYLPGHFPVRLAIDAAFSSGIAIGSVAWAVGYLVALTGLATVGFQLTTRIHA